MTLTVGTWNLENLFDDREDQRPPVDRQYDTWFARDAAARRLKYEHLSEALIRMNDGREFFIEAEQNVMVGDYTAGFLVVDDKRVKRNAVITLSNVADVIPRATRPKK